MNRGEGGSVANEKVELVFNEAGRDPVREDDVQRGDRKLEPPRGDEDVRLLGGRDPTMVLPVLDSGSTLSKLAGHRPDPIKEVEQGLGAAHESSVYVNSVSHASVKYVQTVYEFSANPAGMDSGASRLKKLRESASPKLSIRKAAASVGMPAGTYAAYEDTKRFKKRFIPVELAHALVPVFTAHGVERDAVLALAGIGPDAPAVEPPPAPEIQLITMQVALPSEAALARMFQGLLLPLDLTRPVDELAQMLARRLPIGLSQLQDLMPAPATADAIEDDEAPPAPAKSDRASPRAPRT